MTDFTFLKSKTTGAINRNHCGPKSTIFHRAQPRKHPFLLLINPQDTYSLPFRNEKIYFSFAKLLNKSVVIYHRNEKGEKTSHSRSSAEVLKEVDFLE